jgi:pilus assembly protein Flp/PilA
MVLHDTAYGLLRSRLEAEDGQAIVEYALIVGLISVVAIAALGAVGVDITTLFTRVSSALSGVET